MVGLQAAALENSRGAATTGAGRVHSKLASALAGIWENPEDTRVRASVCVCAGVCELPGISLHFKRDPRASVIILTRQSKKTKQSKKKQTKQTLRTIWNQRSSAAELLRNHTA